jgi:hypothetical protein
VIDMANGAREDLLPHGEALRSAVRWISSQRLEDQKRPLHELLDEAALRFDLSPLQAEFLRTEWLSVRERD